MEICAIAHQRRFEGIRVDIGGGILGTILNVALIVYPTLRLREPRQRCEVLKLRLGISADGAAAGIARI